jgi:hypothetical protein
MTFFYDEADSNSILFSEDNVKQNVILDPISTIGSIHIAPIIEALQTDWS